MPLLQLPPPLFIRPVYSVFLALHCLPPNLSPCLLLFFCCGVTGSRVWAGYGSASVGESGLKQAAVVCLLTSHKQSPSNLAQRGAGEVLANRLPPNPPHFDPCQLLLSDVTKTNSPQPRDSPDFPDWQRSLSSLTDSNLRLLLCYAPSYLFGMTLDTTPVLILYRYCCSHHVYYLIHLM